MAGAAERLRGRVRRTPLIESHALGTASGRQVWLKLESLQRTRSFKYRGAMHALLRRGERGSASLPVVTASAGNHGRALAAAAAALRVRLQVFAPETTPASKLEGMRLDGVVVDTSSADFDEAERRALDVAGRGDAEYISPYNHPDVIAGAGTVALEVLHELPGAASIVVPTGGGGLLSGIALGCAGRALVLGVESDASPGFSTSLAAGAITPIAPGPSLADGLIGNLEAGSRTFDIVRQHARGVRRVPERDVVNGVRALFDHDRLVAEGAGAIGVGALLAGLLDDLPQPIVLVVSGANIDADVLTAVLTA